VFFFSSLFWIYCWFCCFGRGLSTSRGSFVGLKRIIDLLLFQLRNRKEQEEGKGRKEEERSSAVLCCFCCCWSWKLVWGWWASMLVQKKSKRFLQLFWILFRAWFVGGQLYFRFRFDLNKMSCSSSFMLGKLIPQLFPLRSSPKISW